jgi:hypothetical protein
MGLGNTEKRPNWHWKAVLAVMALSLMAFAAAAALAVASMPVFTVASPPASKDPSDGRQAPPFEAPATTMTTLPQAAATTTTTEPTLPSRKTEEPAATAGDIASTTTTTEAAPTSTTISPYAGKGYRQAWLDITIPSPHCEQALLTSLKDKPGIVSVKVKRGSKNNTIIYDPDRIGIEDILQYTGLVGGSQLLGDGEI